MATGRFEYGDGGVGDRRLGMAIQKDRHLYGSVERKIETMTERGVGSKFRSRSPLLIPDKNYDFDEINNTSLKKPIQKVQPNHLNYNHIQHMNTIKSEL